MTLISTIIADAFRESNLIATGTSPTAAETTEALALLNRFVLGLYMDEVGENFSDLPYGRLNIVEPDFFDTNYDDFDDEPLPKNVRLVCNLEGAKTVYLPAQPNDGTRFAAIDSAGNFSTYNLVIAGNGRKIEGAASVTLNTNSITRSWFYRADLGDWKRVTDLLTSDSNPFPTEFDDILVIGLAMRLNPRYGSVMSQETLLHYQKLLKKMRARYGQIVERPSEVSNLRLSSDKYYYDSSTKSFQKGRLW